MIHEQPKYEFEVDIIHNELLQSASYILSNGDSIIIVDCGDSDKIIKAIGKKRKPDAIILTHCHQDHVYGLSKLMMQYPCLSIYCSQSTLNGLKNEEQNLSYIIPEYPINFCHEKQVIIINEGKYNINGLLIEVIFTPGHSDDCTTYIVNDCIFTGDSYIPFARVFTKWPSSNKILAIRNETKLEHLVNERQLKVYSGHWK